MLARSSTTLRRLAWGMPAQLRSSLSPARLAWGIPALVLVVLALPLFTNRTFGNDWPDHLWLVWQQAQDIAKMGRPSYFLGLQGGVYEPFFAFYGGTFYAVTGALADVIGNHPTVAFCAVIILAFTGAYLGWTWLAHQVGLRGWRAQVPGLLYVTAPYFITNPFGRGDIPEAVGTAAIPMVAASALAVLRVERVRPLHAAALVLSVTWFTACHNITTLWGTTFLLATGLVVVFAVGWRRLRPRRILALLALAALGAAVNAWFLFPAVAYSGRTFISHGGLGAFFLDSWHVIFSPLRNEPEISTSGKIETQMPVLAFGWAVVVLLIAKRRLPEPWRRFAGGMFRIVLGLLLLILTDMSFVPHPWSEIQFPYRGETYVALGVCALVLAAIAAAAFISDRRLRRIASGVLILITAFSFGQAIEQQWSQPSELASRSLVYQPEGIDPPTWYSGYVDYSDISMPGVLFSSMVSVPGLTVTGPNGEPFIPVSMHRHSDINTVSFSSPGEHPIATDIYGGSYLVKVTGARAVGRSPSDELVIEPEVAKGKAVKVTFSTAHTFPVVLGIITTLAAISLCLLLGAWATWRVWRRGGLRVRRWQKDRDHSRSGSES